MNPTMIKRLGRDATGEYCYSALEEREKAKTQLLQAQKMETIGTLTAGLAHEINNPVTSIILNIPTLECVWKDIGPILEKDVGKDPNRTYGGFTVEYLKENMNQIILDIKMSADHIAGLIDKLKNFVKHSDVLDMEPMHINIAVENAIRLTHTTARKKSIEIEIRYGENLSLVEGHSSSIEQTVINIILNAIEAMIKLGSCQPDIMLLDIIMPDIPIILCSGYNDVISEDEAKRIGINAFSMKPIKEKDLANTVREVLDD